MPVYAQITWPTGATHVEELANLPKFIQAVCEDHPECLVGESYTVTFIKLTPAEYAALPEFTGP